MGVKKILTVNIIKNDPYMRERAWRGGEAARAPDANAPALPCLSGSDRALVMARLIDQVDAIVRASGNPDGFKAAEWVGEWAQQPLAALGGRKPEELLATDAGCEAVSNLLAQMQSGAFA